jgi:hypothetical protein
MTDERRAALQRIAKAKAMCPDDVAALLADHERLRERVARMGEFESALPSLAFRLDELREQLGLVPTITAGVVVERARERIRELEGRIARAVAIVENEEGEEGEYAAGGSASDAVQDMMAALEGEDIDQ